MKIYKKLFPLYPLISTCIAWGIMYKSPRGGGEFLVYVFVFLVVPVGVITTIFLVIMYFVYRKQRINHENYFFLSVLLSLLLLIPTLPKIPYILDKYIATNCDSWLLAKNNPFVDEYAVLYQEPFKKSHKELFVFKKDNQEEQIVLKPSVVKEKISAFSSGCDGQILFPDRKQFNHSEWGRLIEFEKEYYFVGFDDPVYAIWKIDFKELKTSKFFFPYTDEYHKLIKDILKNGSDNAKEVILLHFSSFVFNKETTSDKSECSEVDKIIKNYNEELDFIARENNSPGVFYLIRLMWRFHLTDFEKYLETWIQSNDPDIRYAAAVYINRYKNNDFISIVEDWIKKETDPRTLSELKSILSKNNN